MFSLPPFSEIYRSYSLNWIGAPGNRSVACRRRCITRNIALRGWESTLCFEILAIPRGHFYNVSVEIPAHYSNPSSSTVRPVYRQVWSQWHVYFSFSLRTTCLLCLQQPHYQQTVIALLFLLITGVICQQVVLDNDKDEYSVFTNPTVAIEESGPSHTDLNETVSQALNLCQVRELLNNTRHRLLFSAFDDAPRCGTKSGPHRFQAAIYDYTNARTLFVNGIPFDNSTVSTTEANTQPLPNAEELAEAGRIAGIHPYEIAHHDMPPVSTLDFPNGTSHRIVNIAIISPNASRSAHVNMNALTAFFPPNTSSTLLTCFAPQPDPNAKAQAIGSEPGTAAITISQGGTKLWTFDAIRPAASSGKQGSGIELRNVKYKGKSVLYRAHVPILNVQYGEDRGTCGPFYRDWQHDEYPFQCHKGRDIAHGFRICSSPPKSILESGSDGGDFVGVAIYIEGQEVVLKSQLGAGWYRYISEWRFHLDGTLKPRFGFGAVHEAHNNDFCVCYIHHHHVYWRLDFDIVTSGNNLVREYNNPPLFPPSNYHDKVFEILRPKDPRHRRHWEISHPRTGSTYSLVPGSNDGTSDAFGVGDLWVLKYHFDEIDDGVRFVETERAKANIDKFKDGEGVRDTDVVLWYGAHFKHDQGHAGGGNHVVGPDIIPVRW